jgi:hypothetical protein
MDCEWSKTEVADKINYLGITFKSGGGWKSQKPETVGKGNQTLVATDKTLTRTRDIRV